LFRKGELLIIKLSFDKTKSELKNWLVNNLNIGRDRKEIRALFRYLILMKKNKIK
jgi:hypothetical protein